MIKPGKIVRLLRRFSLLLIALPEPITTAFGVVLLGFTFYLSHALSRIIERSLNTQAEEKLTSYLTHFKHFGDDTECEAGAPDRTKRPREEHVLPRQLADSRSLKAGPDPSLWQGLRDSGGCAVHHAVNMQSLSWRYGLRDSSAVGTLESDFGATFASVEKQMHPGIDRKMTARRFKAAISRGFAPDWPDETIAAENVMHHAINMGHLSRRYQGKESIVAASQSACGTDIINGVVHHTVKIRQNPQRCEQNEADQVQVRHHAVNIASIQRRFSPAGRSAPALKVYRTGFDLLNVSACPA